MVSRAVWGWARAREMSLRELPHRVREQVRRRLDRGRPVPTAPPGPLPRWPVEVVLDEAARQQVAQEVRRVRADGFDLLGQRILPGQRVGGEVDPRTGHRWHGWCFDLDLRHGPDPKPLMELHRLQHLQILALGGRDAFGTARADLQAWVRQAPPLWGIGWTSGLEVACRAVSLLRVADAWHGAGATDPERAERQEVRDALLAHGWYLERYPSLHSSANNHRIAEASALVLLGSVSDGEEGRRWLRLGLDALREAVPGVILEDGVGAEMSLAYLAFTLEWLLLARVACRLPDVVEQRAGKAAAFLGSVLDDAGEVPAIGDADDGVVLRQAYPERGYPRSVVGAAGAVLGRPELIPAGWVPDLRARVLGVDARRREARPVEGAERARSRCHPQGGVTVLRSDRVVAVVDHGPLGWPALAAHGHADALSVHLQADGRPVLVGLGTYRYRGERAWRQWLRGTGAHNTVVVDGLDQSEPHDDPFLWRSRAQATLRAVHLRPDGGRVVASHDGYQRIGVHHRREVHLTRGTLVVWDHLAGEGRHRVEIPLHFAPDLEVREEEPAGWTVRRGGRLVGSVAAGLAGQVIRQDAETLRPGPGAHAPRYGVLAPTTSLWLRGEVLLPWSHRWTLALTGLR